MNSYIGDLVVELILDINKCQYFDYIKGDITGLNAERDLILQSYNDYLMDTWN